MARKRSTFGVSKVLKNDEQMTKIIKEEARREEQKFGEYASSMIKKQGFIPVY